MYDTFIAVSSLYSSGGTILNCSIDIASIKKHEADELAKELLARVNEFYSKPENKKKFLKWNNDQGKKGKNAK